MRIKTHDCAGMEQRLLRQCARPAFSMKRLGKAGSALVYRCAKQRSEPSSDKRGAEIDELTLTPLELEHIHNCSRSQPSQALGAMARLGFHQATQ